MLVDIRPTARLRGPDPIDLTTALDPVLSALREHPGELSHLRVVCDWVQYKNNFRAPVDVRVIQSATGSVDDVEIALDLRRCAAITPESVTRALAGAEDAAMLDRLYLEDWTVATRSRIWDFNSLYWRFLGDWEKATGRTYEQALPGGESDARNVDAVHELINEMLAVWDDLAARNSLPEELFVVELGVGNGSQARTWLDEFAELDRRHGSDYYRRLHYLMCDYSEHVLGLAREAVADHADHVSSFVLDATEPTTALGFLRYKVFLVYISNVYDNLPTEEVAQIGADVYRVQTRAYLDPIDVADLGASTGLDRAGLLAAIDRLLQLGPGLLCEANSVHFADPDAAASFWQAVWQALRVEERYAPLTGMDGYEVAPGVSGEILRPLLEAHGDVRMQVSNGAVASFVDTLPLLHPYGRLQCHDILVTDPRRYHSAFLGPGKYDGSIVNWVNGPLLRQIGARKGFDVRYTPFAHRSGTNIVTLTAQVRD